MKKLIYIASSILVIAGIALTVQSCAKLDLQPLDH
jgi:hypothetical protein